MTPIEKIVIFGATGATGHFLVQEGLRRGYQVRAAARTPGKLGIQHPDLHTFQSDIYNPASVHAAIEGQEAVLVSLAPSGFSLTEKTDIFTQSARAIIPAMAQHGVRRLLMISTSARSGISWDNHPVFEFGIKRIFWRTLYADVVAMDQMIMAADVDWTLVRPPRVTDQPNTGQYRIREGAYTVPKGASIGRADLAEYMVSLIEQPRVYRQNVAIAY